MQGFNWKNPDYVRVLEQRTVRLEALRAEPEQWEGVKAYYANDHPADFINDWACTYDPRNSTARLDGVKLPTTMPFVLFDKQREFLDWLLKRWKTRDDGVCEKSRDMGVSWLCVGFGVWMWTFKPGSVIGFGSRKEDYVDKIGEPSCLFWKARTLVRLLPYELRPPRYDEKAHAPHMRLLNPDNESAIIGEAGDNIGRGARASIYFKDEAQPLHARVLTPCGWATMADMAVGSEVIGPDGHARRVTQVKECGTHAVYRVAFSDGTFTEASHNHLWALDKVIGKRERVVLRTHELADSLTYVSPGGQTLYRWRAPVTAPIEFAAAPALPLDPYIVGALLGDGSVGDGSVRLTSADPQIVREIERSLPPGVVVTGTGITYRLVSAPGRGKGTRGNGNAIRQAVRDTGIAGMRSLDKHVPQAYRLASPEARLALLQGLMDTDGSASGGVASFHTSSARLAEDTRFIVESLGGTATHNVKPDGRGYRDMHVLHMTLPAGAVPFRLDRKVRGLRPRKHPPGRSVLSVTLIGEMPVRCISVDAEDGLYLTDHCIVTHNSAFYDNQDAVDAALSQTANTKIDVSTPNGEGNLFWRKRHEGKLPVFVFDWRDDPRKGEGWYAEQRRKMDAVKLAQEVDRDYSASVSNAFIGAPLVTTAMLKGPADVRPMGGLRFGLDVARFGDDKCVLSVRRGRVLLKQFKWGKVNLETTAGRTKQLIDSYCKNGERPEQIAVDVIGLGSGVADMLRGWYDPDSTQFGRPDPGVGIVVDVNSATLLSDGEHYNLRAFMWVQMREWLGTASIPNDQELRVALTSLRYGFRGGALLIESKDDAKGRGMRSPDEADSLALTFAYPTARRTPKPVPPGLIANYAVDSELGM